MAALEDLRSHLENQLAAKRDALIETESTLKKYVGERVMEERAMGRPGIRRRPDASGEGRGLGRGLGEGRGFGDRGDDRGGFGGGGDRDRGGRGLQDRLGQRDPVDDDVGGGGRRSVVSRVINVDSESRKEALEQAKGDTKSAARNKRMFGNLLGTLQKFTKDEVKQKEVVEKQKVALMKVEEKNEREKEEMRNRKRELFDEQRKKKKDIQILQIQLKRTEEFEAWEASKKSEVNFIRTKGEQNPIYWLPKNHSEKTEGLLSETKTAIEKELEEKREAFEQELVGIEKRMMADLERRQQQFKRQSNEGEMEGGLDESANGDGEEGAEDERPGFMSGRVVVERREDLAKDDLRMMIRNEKNGEGNRDRDEEEEKENLESRRVVVKEEEEMNRRENEKKERRREKEMRKDVGGRRVARLEKAIGDKAENSDEDVERSRGASSRNEKDNASEGRGEMKSPVSKGSIERTSDAAEGEKRLSVRKRQRSRREAEREKRGSSESSSEEESKRPKKKKDARGSASPRKAKVSTKSTKKKKSQKQTSSSSSDSSDSE